MNSTWCEVSSHPPAGWESRWEKIGLFSMYVLNMGLFTYGWSLWGHFSHVCIGQGFLLMTLHDVSTCMYRMTLRFSCICTPWCCFVRISCTWGQLYCIHSGGIDIQQRLSACIVWYRRNLACHQDYFVAQSAEVIWDVVWRWIVNADMM